MKISEIILSQGLQRRFRGPRKPRQKQVGFHKRLSGLLDSTAINEGGAMPGVGAIHISEISPTLVALEKILGIDLQNNVLGSVGKKQFSGDIDVALNIDADKIPEFMERLKRTPEVKDIAKSSVIMTKVQIVGYDDTKQVEGKPRTGYVQVDFMPGDPDWLKTYYHSPYEKDSKYKGVHRNIMIASIAGALNVKSSEERIDDGRPLEQERWMFSPTDGLIRVKRTPVPNKKGEGYTKKNNNEIIAGPFKGADQIADVLNLGTAADLDSFETLYNAVKKNYPQQLQREIFDAFKKNPTIANLGVPSELGESARPVTENARIQHVEDFAIWYGSSGIAKAVQTLKNLETAPDDVTVKWDGSPAVIFGRNENGEFVLTDKSGFTAKGYDGKVTNKEDMAKMFLGRGKDAPDESRKAFVKKMTNVWDTFERATPKDFSGYVQGDLLYFTKPEIVDGDYEFTPNVVTYRVKPESAIGKKISRSTAGVVLHVYMGLDGEKSKVDANAFDSGALLVMPPVTITKAPKIQAENLDKVVNFAKTHATKIDSLLDDSYLNANKLTSFKNALYTYVNNMTRQRRLNNLTGDFAEWIDTAKMSDQMKQRMLSHVNENADGMKALFTVVANLMKVKNDIISQLDADEADVEAYTAGQRGGEGYVIGQGDSKLVNRSGFSAANMNTER